MKQPTSKLYALCPGIIVSAKTGKRYYISAPELARLYRVEMSECVVYEDGEDLGDVNSSDYVYLFPNAHGNYTVPGGNKQ